MKRLFKLTTLLCALAVSATLLVSCKTDTDDDDEAENEVHKAVPYLPEEFADKTVAALFTYEEDYQMTSFYFFDNEEWVLTYSNNCDYKYAQAKGTYTHIDEDFSFDDLTLKVLFERAYYVDDTGFCHFDEIECWTPIKDLYDLDFINWFFPVNNSSFTTYDEIFSKEVKYTKR